MSPCSSRTEDPSFRQSLPASRPSSSVYGGCLTQGQTTDGGDEEVRTPDPLRARQVLSQLSYTPIHLAARDLSSPTPRKEKRPTLVRRLLSLR